MSKARNLSVLLEPDGEVPSGKMYDWDEDTTAWVEVV